MKIPVGIATLLGTIGGAVAMIIPLLGDLADAAAPLGVSPDVWVKVGAVLWCVVIIGRMAQAAAGMWNNPTPPNL